MLLFLLLFTSFSPSCFFFFYLLLFLLRTQSFTVFAGSSHFSILHILLFLLLASFSSSSCFFFSFMLLFLLLFAYFSPSCFFFFFFFFLFFLLLLFLLFLLLFKSKTKQPTGVYLASQVWDRRKVRDATTAKTAETWDGIFLGWCCLLSVIRGRFWPKRLCLMQIVRDPCRSHEIASSKVGDPRARGRRIR